MLTSAPHKAARECLDRYSPVRPLRRPVLWQPDPPRRPPRIQRRALTVRCPLRMISSLIFCTALLFVCVSIVVAEIPPGGAVLHVQPNKQAPQRILTVALAAIENSESASGTSASPFDLEIDRAAEFSIGEGRSQPSLGFTTCRSTDHLVPLAATTYPAGSRHVSKANSSWGALIDRPGASTCSELTVVTSMERGRAKLLTVAQSSISHSGDRSHESTFSAILDKRIRSRCHMGSCGWFALTASSIEAKVRDGVLYRVDSHWWSAEYPDADYDAPAALEDDGQDSSLVFCSLTRPATFARDGGNWSVSMLSPNDPEGVFGYNISAYIFYFAACHGVVTDAGDAMTGLAERLGYRISATRVGQSEVSTPQEYIRDR